MVSSWPCADASNTVRQARGPFPSPFAPPPPCSPPPGWPPPPPAPWPPPAARGRRRRTAQSSRPEGGAWINVRGAPGHTLAPPTVQHTNFAGISPGRASRSVGAPNPSGRRLLTGWCSVPSVGEESPFGLSHTTTPQPAHTAALRSDHHHHCRRRPPLPHQRTSLPSSVLAPAASSSPTTSRWPSMAAASSGVVPAWRDAEEEACSAGHTRCKGVSGPLWKAVQALVAQVAE